MNGTYEDLKNPRRRLPEVGLTVLPSGAVRNAWRPGSRRSSLLLILDRGDCDECASYLEEIAARSGSISEWDGDVLLVLPPPDGRIPMAVRLPAEFVVTEDRSGQLVSRLGVEPPAVVIADRWGVLRAVHPGGVGHDLMPPDEVVQWLRFIAIECPECEGEAF